MAQQERAFLQFLLHATPAQAKLTLSASSRDQLKALGEVSYNILYGKLEAEVLGNLKSFQSLLRQLCDKRLSITRRRKLATRKAKAVVNILRLVKDILP